MYNAQSLYSTGAHINLTRAQATNSQETLLPLTVPVQTSRPPVIENPLSPSTSLVQNLDNLNIRSLPRGPSTSTTQFKFSPPQQRTYGGQQLIRGQCAFEMVSNYNRGNELFEPWPIASTSTGLVPKRRGGRPPKNGQHNTRIKKFDDQINKLIQVNEALKRELAYLQALIRHYKWLIEARGVECLDQLARKRE